MGISSQFYDVGTILNSLKLVIFIYNKNKLLINGKRVWLV